MSTQTEIANQALRNFGQSRITDINENTPAAQAIRDVWDTARRAALRAHHWNFAQRQAELTASSETPLFKWRFSYPLPSDYLRLISCNCVPSGVKITYFDVQQGASAVGDPSPQPLALVSNWSTAKIEYTADVVPCAYWDDQFVEAFGFMLASKVAASIMGDGGNAAALMAQRNFQSLLQAMSSDAIESKPKVVSALQGSAYQAARVLPSPGNDFWPWWDPEGIPVEYGVPFNPYNIPAP